MLCESHVLDKTKKQIADDTGVSHQAVSAWYNSGIDKLKTYVGV